MIGSNNNSNADLMKAISTLTRAVDNISKTFSERSHTQRHTSPGASRPGKPGQAGRGSEASDRKAQKQADTLYERNKRLARDQEKTFGRLISELHDAHMSIAKFASTVGRSSKDYKENLKRHNELLKGVIESDKMGRRFQDHFVSQMSGIMKSSKSMSGQKLTSTSTHGRMKELLAIQENMNSVANKVNAVKKSAGASSVSDMKEGSIKYLMQSLNNRGLSADGMDLKKFEKDLAAHDDKIASKRREYIKAKASGNTTRADALKYEMGILKDNKSDFLKGVGGKIEKTVSGVENFNKSLSRAAFVNTGLSVASDIATDSIRKLGGEGISMASGFKMIGKAMYDYYQYMKTLSSQQMGGASWDIAAQAMSMGASVDATAKYFKTMAFQVSQLGFDKITNIVKNNRESFSKLGLFGDEAVKYAGEFTQNLMLMGTHPKDEKKFNKAIGAYSERINEMAQLTGASVSDLVAQDRAILNNAETQKMMMRLNDQQRSQKTQELLLEKQRLTYLIGSNEEASKFIQTLQKINGEKADKRLENSVKIQQLMSTIGLGADAGRMANVMMKREDQLTKEDREFMQKTYMEIGKRTNQIQGQGGFTSEYLIDQFVGAQGSTVQAAIQAGADAALSADQRGSVDPKSAAAQKVKDTYQIGSANATLQQLGETYTNFITNPITKLLWTIAAGVAVIAASSIIRTPFGKNLIDSAKGKIDGWVAGKGSKTAVEGVEKAVQGGSKVAGTVASDVAKTAATDAGKTVAADVAKTAATDVGKTVAKDAGKGIGKSILKKIPGIGLIAGLGFAASRAMEGDWLGAGGELASGAASTVPGLGTAASVAIDGALLARDISKASDGVTANPTENTNTQVKAPSAQELSKAQTPAINNESNDPNTKRKASLEDLLYSVNSGTEAEQDKMDEMIKLLKTLIETVKPENNGLLDAIKSGKGTGISFNDLHDKRTLFATK